MGFWTLEICADNGGVWWITAEARLDEEGEHPPDPMVARLYK